MEDTLNTNRLLSRLLEARAPLLPHDYEKHERFYRIDEHGDVWSWGLETRYRISGKDIGLLGHAEGVSLDAPRRIPELVGRRARSIALGEYGQPVFVMTNTEVWAWGGGQNGVMGDGHIYSAHMQPQLIFTVPRDGGYLVQVIARDRVAAVLTSHGVLYTWGMHSWGCGHRTTRDLGTNIRQHCTTVPTVPEFLAGVRVIWACFDRIYREDSLVAVTADGRALRITGEVPLSQVEPALEGRDGDTTDPAPQLAEQDSGYSLPLERIPFNLSNLSTDQSLVLDDGPSPNTSTASEDPADRTLSSHASAGSLPPLVARVSPERGSGTGERSLPPPERRSPSRDPPVITHEVPAVFEKPWRERLADAHRTASPPSGTQPNTIPTRSDAPLTTSTAAAAVDPSGVVDSVGVSERAKALAEYPAHHPITSLIFIEVIMILLGIIYRLM